MLYRGGLYIQISEGELLYRGGLYIQVSEGELLYRCGLYIQVSEGELLYRGGLYIQVRVSCYIEVAFKASLTVDIKRTDLLYITKVCLH